MNYLHDKICLPDPHENPEPQPEGDDGEKIVEEELCTTSRHWGDEQEEKTEKVQEDGLKELLSREQDLRQNEYELETYDI